MREYLRAAFSSAPPTEETDPLLLFSRFRPDQADLVGDIVKTRGRLTYREGERGAVEVTADVTFVYPVTPAAGDGGADAEVIRTIVRREVVMSWDDPSKVVTEPDTMSLVSYSVDMTNGGCSSRPALRTPLRQGRPAARRRIPARPVRPQRARRHGDRRRRLRDRDPLLRRFDGARRASSSRARRLAGTRGRLHGGIVRACLPACLPSGPSGPYGPSA
ncbi:hypothetical protein SALBM217S_08327 [Streptomyces griseoloalbus]